MHRPVAAALAALIWAGPLVAQATGPVAADQAVPDNVRALHEALLLPELVVVSSRDGAEYGDVVARSIFGAAPVPGDWSEIVSAIYDPVHMESEILESLARSLEGEDTAAMLAFFEAEPGRTLVAEELAAREALSDEEAEQAAREAAAVAMAEDSPRLDLLRRFVEENDLLETNVSGVMNSSFAYMAGLMDGGALRGEMTEQDILADIWLRVPQIRANAEEWLYAFLLEAYADVSDADLEALIAFSETEAGQALNRAVNVAFEERYSGISRALGIAAARYLTTEAL